LLVVSLDLSTQGYDDAASGLAFADRVRESVSALPGVATAAVADGLPVDLVGNFAAASRADRPDAGGGVQTEFTRVGAGFFQAVGTRVLRGRGIEPSDTSTSPRAVVVGRRLAERLWPGEDALGRQIRLNLGKEKGGAPYTVIGVIDDAVRPAPAFYTVNCMHPHNLLSGLRKGTNRHTAIRRLIGIQANASLLEPHRLDGSAALQQDAFDAIVGDMLELRRDFDFKVFGGCCGTDAAFMRALVKTLTSRWSAVGQAGDGLPCCCAIGAVSARGTMSGVLWSHACCDA
jgi:hypothetical protein